MDDDAFNTLCRRLAEEIRTARQLAGLSQEALALVAEVDRTYVSQLERGIANPSLQILCRLAEALGAKLNISLIHSKAVK